MREIEFRAWDKDNDRMLYSYIPDEQKKREFIFVEFCIGFSHYNANQLEMMQYIGLKDKTGRKFYKDDIGEFDNGNRFFIDCEEWLEFFVSWIGEPECEDQARDLYRIEESKIIGNRHENKDLLNGNM
jgi:hypothetical protein